MPPADRRRRKPNRADANAPSPETSTASVLTDSPRTVARHCVIVAIVAVAVRATYLWAYEHSPLAGFLQADQRLYWDWAVALSLGDWLGDRVYAQGPLYPHLLGSLFALTGPYELPVLVAQLLVGVVNCLLVYDSGRRLWGSTTGLVAGSLAACYGPLVFYECMILKTFLSPTLTMVSLWAGLRYQVDGRWKWIGLAGGSIGLATLVAENHLLLLIPWAWWIWRQYPEMPDSSAWQIVGRIAVLAGACGAMMLPSATRNAIVGGEFVAVTSGGGEVFYLGHGPDATGYYSAPSFVRADPRFEHDDFRREAGLRLGREVSPGESSRYWLRQAIAHAVSQPGRLIRLTIAKGLILFNNFEVPDSENYQVALQLLPGLRWLPSFGWISGLGLLGLILAAREGPAQRLAVGLGLCHVAAILLLFNFGRFRLGLTPIWILGTAYGAVWLYQQMLEQRSKLSWRPMAAAGLVFVATVISLPRPIGYYETQYEEHTAHDVAQFRARAAALPKLDELRQAAARERGPSTQARWVFARALVDDGSWDEAERVYESIRRDDPRHEPMLRQWAAVKVTRGQIQRGPEIHAQVAGLTDDQAQCHHELALVLMRAEHWELARRHLESSLATKSDAAAAHYDLGIVLAKLGQTPSAVDHYREAIRLNPKHAYAHNNLGLLLLAQGAEQQARRHFELAIQADPQLQPAHENLRRAGGSRR